MTRTKHRKTGVSRGRANISGRAMCWGILAAGLATISFGQVSAAVGLRVPVFAPFGASFFSFGKEQRDLDIAYVESKGRVDGTAYVEFGRHQLVQQPLSTKALRTVGIGMLAQGDVVHGRAAMQAASKTSRRDLLTQQWMLQDRVIANDVEGAMHQFDVLLRTKPSLRPQVLPQLAQVLALPQARQALAKQLRVDTPWYNELLTTASLSPQTSVPMAQFLVDQPKLPDVVANRINFERIVSNVAASGQYDLLRRFYQKMPMVDQTALTGVGLTEGYFDKGFAPIAWKLSDRTDWGVSNLSHAGQQPMLSVFAQPLTRGTVLSKILFLDGRSASLNWTLAAYENSGAAQAKWSFRCVSPGSDSVTESGNLFDTPLNAAQQLDFPAGCAVARIELMVAGGTGGQQSTLDLQSISLRGVPVVR